jgi:hypothetical protein
VQVGALSMEAEDGIDSDWMQGRRVVQDAAEGRDGSVEIEGIGERKKEARESARRGEDKSSECPVKGRTEGSTLH